MTPEEKARQEIDRQLAACGWLVQDHKSMNSMAGLFASIEPGPFDTFRHEPVSSWKRIQMSFFKLEPSVLYAVMGLAALVVWLLVRNHMLTISPGGG